MEKVLGPASLQRTGDFGFPVDFLAADDGSSAGRTLARLGRGGWFRIFFGRGRRIELPDGTIWRVAATETGPYIVPIVTSASGKLAIAVPHGEKSYVISGRDFAYNFYPTSRRGLRKSSWTLREHDVEHAFFESRSSFASHEVPLAAMLLCFTLIKYGVPGESALGIPQFRWA